MFFTKQLETWPAPAAQLVACSALCLGHSLARARRRVFHSKRWEHLMKIITFLACGFGGLLVSVRIS